MLNKMKKSNFNIRMFIMAAAIGLTFATCEETEDEIPEANIIAFTFDDINGRATIDKEAKTITADAKETVELTTLVVEFELSKGATAKVGGKTQKSGETANSFRTPVHYMVTSSDGKIENDWTVTDTGGKPVTLQLDERLILTDGQAWICNDVTLSGYVFYADGTYTFNWGSNFVVSTEGTWSASGNTLTLFYYAAPNGQRYTYSISGNSLTVTNAFGDATVYTKGTPPSASDIAVTLVDVAANGSPAASTTTKLTLTFSAAIGGLAADNINLAGIDGVIKGTLTAAGSVYELPISGFTAGGTLTVNVTKTGYNISGSPKTVTVYHAGDVPPLRFTTFTFSGMEGYADIDEAALTVKVMAACGTDITRIKPEFFLSPNDAVAIIANVIQQSGVSVVDFTQPKVYKIANADRTNSADWTVTVEKSTDCNTCMETEDMYYCANQDELGKSLRNAHIWYKYQHYLADCKTPVEAEAMACAGRLYVHGTWSDAADFCKKGFNNYTIEVYEPCLERFEAYSLDDNEWLHFDDYASCGAIADLSYQIGSNQNHAIQWYYRHDKNQNYWTAPDIYQITGYKRTTYIEPENTRTIAGKQCPGYSVNIKSEQGTSILDQVQYKVWYDPDTHVGMRYEDYSTGNTSKNELSYSFEITNIEYGNVTKAQVDALLNAWLATHNPKDISDEDEPGSGW
jgi:hypothetical protein